MKTFQEMALAEELQKALHGLKFIEPTKIQDAVIPVMTEGRDLMASAETGSGKTAAYGIPLVSQLLLDEKKTALILTPTRELAIQIAEFLGDLTKYCRGIRVTSLVGGADMYKQLRALRQNPRIIVATPGRLTDHLKRRSLRLDAAELLILDEGDRMLDMGFAPQLDEVLRHLPRKRQTALFSATLPEKVMKLAQKYLRNPEKINVGRVSLPVASIKQAVIQTTFKAKDDLIVDELNKREGSVMVFCRTKRRTDILMKILAEFGFKVGLIHGGRSQGQRNKAIQDFRSGKIRILCATDVAARGIDIPQVEHVINFDLPMMEEDYVHRIGRTARNGASGEAVSFVMPDEQSAWKQLARTYKIPGVELKKVAGGSGGGDPTRGRGRNGPPSYGQGRPSSGRGAAGGGEGSFRSKKRPSRKATANKKWSFGETSSQTTDRPSTSRPRRESSEGQGQGFATSKPAKKWTFGESSSAPAGRKFSKGPRRDKKDGPSSGGKPAGRFGKKKPFNGPGSFSKKSRSKISGRSARS